MKLYRHRISMTIVCEDKKLRLHEVEQIQSPGPIDYIADVTSKEMDPCVESISVEKSSALSAKEVHDYLPYDDTDPVGNKHKAGKQYKKSESQKVRVKGGLIHLGDLVRALAAVGDEWQKDHHGVHYKTYLDREQGAHPDIEGYVTKKAGAYEWVLHVHGKNVASGPAHSYEDGYKKCDHAANIELNG